MKIWGKIPAVALSSLPRIKPTKPTQRIVQVSVGRSFIGPFQLLRLIRSGTTTAVWEAKRIDEKERVALKILLSDFRTDKDEIGQLKHEAMVGNFVNHPNVIKIFGYHEDQGFPLVSMQLYQARNLKIEIRERPEVLAENMGVVMRAAAEGLAHLHDVGWIHCDIKPDNYLVDEQANVKLIDFSIAVKDKKKGFLGLGSNKAKTIMGTRSYISPEQIRRKHLDVRADVYGFGCMLFEMMSGKTPYNAASPEQLLSKHLSAPIPNLQAVSGASKDFAALVRIMLAKDPDKRIQTMREFINELDKIQIYRHSMRPKNFRR
jgi:serine/threonine-protein kinase